MDAVPKRVLRTVAAVVAGTTLVAAIVGAVVAVRTVLDDSIATSGVIIGPVETRRDRDRRYSVLIFTGDDGVDEVLARRPTTDDTDPEIYFLWFDSIGCNGAAVEPSRLPPGTPLSFRRDPVVLTSSPAVLVATGEVTADCDHDRR